ncbi:MAG: hypothetical protein DWH78_04500 [Planctomycetota bacterium]|nr:MAG: hypothetical protein DWH78_04500 [Planctomycetota bacterium]
MENSRLPGSFRAVVPRFSGLFEPCRRWRTQIQAYRRMSHTAKFAVLSGLSSRFAGDMPTFRRSGWKFDESTIILRGSIHFERRRSRCI